jgi:hypothetical protein
MVEAIAGSDIGKLRQCVVHIPIHCGLETEADSQGVVDNFSLHPDTGSRKLSDSDIGCNVGAQDNLEPEKAFAAHRGDFDASASGRHGKQGNDTINREVDILCGITLPVEQVPGSAVNKLSLLGEIQDLLFSK